MTAQAVTVNGMVATHLVLRRPYRGVWSCVVDFDQAQDAITGAALVAIGDATFAGTFAPELGGTFSNRTRAFVVGGAGGWRQTVTAQHYHSDSGVRARTVVEALAAQVGETLGTVTLDATLGADFVRASAPAGRVMTAACAGVPWWVAADGMTHVGPRAATEIAAAYEVLDYDPRHKVATIACDDVSSIDVGSVVRARLAVPIYARDVEINVDPERTRLVVWGEEVVA